MEEYSKKTLDHFMSPRNMGEIKDADGVGTVGNMRCGDIMKVYVKVGKRSKYRGPSTEVEGTSTEEQVPSKLGTRNSELGTEDFIEDIKFKTLGCAAAIASSSMMTEMVKGKSLDEAAKVSKDDINKELGILPKVKYHCSILSAEGFQKAIEDYKSKAGKLIS